MNKEENLIDTHIALNQTVNKLYNNLDAKDKIINEQALEIARLKETLLDIKEYIEKSYKGDYGNNENYIPIEHLNLKNCTYERSLVVLDIVNKALGEDK